MLWLASGLLWGALSLQAAQAQDDKLGDLRFGAAYTRARGLSPELSAAHADLAVARSAREETKAAQYPQFGLKSEFDWAHQSIEGDYYGVADLDRSDTFTRLAYGVGLSQALYRPDLLGAADIAQATLEASALALSEVESTLAVTVATEYLAVVDALETQRAQLAQLSATQEQQRQMESRQRSGLARESDVAAVRAAREIALADTIAAENKVEAARLSLGLTVGGEFERVAVLRPQTPLPRLAPADLDGWLKQALEKRPALEASKQALQAARLGVEVAQSRRLPRVDVVGNHAWFDSDGGISGAREDLDQRIGLELTVPIFTSGALSAEIRRAEAELAKAQAEARRLELDVRGGVQQAYIAAVSSYRQIDARRRAVEAAVEAERTALVGFEVGTNTAADWLAAVRARYEAERDFARERLKYLLALVQLKAAAGVLRREDIARVELLLSFPEPGWPAPPDLQGQGAP